MDLFEELIYLIFLNKKNILKITLNWQFNIILLTKSFTIDILK